MVKRLSQLAKDVNSARVHKLRERGFKYPVTTVREARNAGLELSTACALLMQESGGGQNVFGHDPTIFAGAGAVTRKKYLEYKQRRGHTRMQGVGPMQLTWWEFQDHADQLGGCWIPKYNMRVGFGMAKDLIRRYGYVRGLAKYNGAGPAADAYSRSVRARRQHYHDLFSKDK